jgi:Fis family transcriptional regulator, factor for inversion stimulation protein
VLEPNPATYRGQLFERDMRPEHLYPTSAQLDAVVHQMHKAGIVFSDAVQEFKKQFILTVLRDLHWNQIKAARALGIHRNTLRRALRVLDLDARSLRKAERRPAHGVGIPKEKKIAG